MLNKTIRYAIVVLAILAIRIAVEGMVSGSYIMKKRWANPIAGFVRLPELSIEGTTDHSIHWEYDSSVTIQVEVGTQVSASQTIWSTPADVGPFVGAGPAVEPLFLPVSTHLRFIVSGSGATGNLVFNGS